MIETKHTPRPWRVQATGHSFVVEEHTHTEAISVDANGNPCRWSEYTEANARLIAAAPELLEALQRLSAQCERLRMAWQLESDAERNARVVIAKAIGGAA